MFRYKGRTVLLLDPEVSDRLAEDTLDIEDSELMLQHPTKE
jgi:hypothetical protein